MDTMFLLAMSSARQSIYITNPYFLPDDRMTLALTEASKRGVRVVILLPGAIDTNIVRQASRSNFGPLLEAGIEIYEYRAGWLHAKTMTVDGIWATIGSTNLDTRSFALNDEVNAVIYHNEVVGHLEKIFADDLTYSRKVDLQRWRNRSPITGCWRFSPFRFAVSSSVVASEQTHHKHVSMIRTFHLADSFAIADGFCGMIVIFEEMSAPSPSALL